MKKVKLLDFTDFVNESKIEKLDTPKVQIIKLKGVMSQSENPRYLNLVDSVIENFYDIFSVKKDGENMKLDKNRPILNYSMAFENVYEEIGLKKGEFYNDFDEMEKSSNKVSFHKVLGDKPYLPKTVFSIKEAKNLKYPIIAKPAEGQSGKGIEKFTKHEDLETSKYKFDLYSECIEKSREFRGMFCDGKLVAITERITDSKLNQVVGTKKPEDKVKFIYIEQDLDKLPFLKELVDISSDVRKDIKLDVYSLDFFYNDESNDIKIIEINAATGFVPVLAAKLYPFVYEMYYKEKPKSEVMEIVNEISKKYCKLVNDENSTECKKSFAPIKFE